MRNLITSDEIVDRAARKAQSWRYLVRFFGAIGIVTLLGITTAVHAWLHRHVELLLGFLLGTLAQSIPWAIDRWRWLKWFSWQ